MTHPSAIALLISQYVRIDSIFVAGDDEAAKDVVARLIEEIGLAPVDTGSLREGGRRQEPNSPIYNRDMTAAEGRRALAGMS
ncbi:MAG TPA: hypothetical protein VF221_13325 [Chloroflexota bacterium]